MAHIQLHGQCSYSYKLLTATDGDKLKLYRDPIAGASDDGYIRRVYFYTIIDSSYNGKTYNIHIEGYSDKASLNVFNLKKSASTTTNITTSTTIEWSEADPSGTSAYYSSLDGFKDTKTITFDNSFNASYTFTGISETSVLFIRRGDANLAPSLDPANDFKDDYSTIYHYAELKDNLGWYLDEKPQDEFPTACLMTQNGPYNIEQSRAEDVGGIRGIMWHATISGTPWIQRYLKPSQGGNYTYQIGGQQTTVSIARDPHYYELLALIGNGRGTWNLPSCTTSVHAFVGALENTSLQDAEVTAIQAMPWNYRAWGCGDDKPAGAQFNRSCNNGWIQFEMCAPSDLTDSVHFNKVYAAAKRLTIYLCVKYGLNPTENVIETDENEFTVEIPVLTSHAEGHQLGYASNHADPLSWFVEQGQPHSMDWVRDDIEATLMNEYDRTLIEHKQVSWSRNDHTITSEYNIYKYTRKSPGPSPDPEPEPSDIPEPLDEPLISMPAPSSDIPDPITYPSSKWYHAEDLGQTHTPLAPNLSYIDFWFNGKHAREFKLYRVSDGNRYNANLTSSINDTTIDIPGRDGQLWFYAKYQPRKFTINYAFDSLTDSDVRAIRRWLNKDAYGDLIFTEAPSRAYSVKVTSQPTFNFVPFNTYDSSGEQNLYRGEGKIEFTAYYPFAHTPDLYNNYTGTWNGILNGWDGYSWPDDDDPENTIADKVAQHYAYYSQRLPKDENDYWYKTTSNNTNILFVRNYGDLGMPIMIGLTSSTSTLNLTIYRHTINGYVPINQLVIAPHDEDLIWNSATGLIYEMNNNKQIVHNEKCLKGNTVMALEPFENKLVDYYAFVYEGGELNDENLDIKFWYY